MAATRVANGHDRLPPTPDPMDVVFHTNMGVNSIGDGQWRPLSSISYTDNSHVKDHKETENSGEEGEPATVSLRSKSRVSIAPLASTNEEQGPIHVQGFSSYPQRDPPPTRATSTASHRVIPTRRRSHRLRTAPGKMERRTTELHKAFVTMDARNRVTGDVIKGSARTSVNAFGDRVCRPYSVYTVTQECERLAISPFGGPLMNSAAGRYRERYLTKHRPDIVQDTTRGNSGKTTFQRFYDNLDLLAINVKRIPFGTLRKPPPKQARKADSQTKSVPTQLHKYTSERIANLHESMDRQDGRSSPRIDGKRLSVMGVEYKVAMEVSSNLEKHRKSRPSNVPGLPNLTAARADAPRLQTQSERLLTPGELSLKDGISSNLFDSERSKRGPIKAIEKPPRRVKSPPLSKLSREKFYPEAQRRREQETWAELRIGRPITPPASEYTVVHSPSFATTVRPLTSMTSRTGVSESEGKAKSTKSKNDDLPTQCNQPEDESSSHKEISDETGSKDSDKNKQSEEKIVHGVIRDQFETLLNDPVVDVSQESEQGASETPLSSRSLVVTVPDSDGALSVDIGEVTVKDELGVAGEAGSEITDGEKVISAGTEYSKNTVSEAGAETAGPVEHNQDVKTDTQLDESIDENQSVEVDGQSDEPVEQNPNADHDCQPKETASKDDTGNLDAKPEEPVEQDHSENPDDKPNEPGDYHKSGNTIDQSVEPDGRDQFGIPNNQPVELVDQDTSVDPDDHPDEQIEQGQNMINDNEMTELVDNELVEPVDQGPIS